MSAAFWRVCVGPLSALPTRRAGGQKSDRQAAQHAAVGSSTDIVTTCSGMASGWQRVKVVANPVQVKSGCSKTFPQERPAANKACPSQSRGALLAAITTCVESSRSPSQGCHPRRPRSVTRVRIRARRFRRAKRRPRSGRPAPVMTDRVPDAQQAFTLALLVDVAETEAVDRHGCPSPTDYA